MMINGMRVLVTGGAGFIGSHLVERLAAGNRVTVADNLSVGRAENLDDARAIGRVDLVEADIRDGDRMRGLLAKTDVVFHLAVVCLRTSIQQPELAHEVNATATLDLLSLARAEAVRRFLYCSSSEVYGTARTAPMNEDHPLAPQTVYGASKLAGEQYALSFYRTYGLEVAAVRPFNAYGPRAAYAGARGEVIPRFILSALAGRPLVVLGDGEQTRDFTYVGDVARGLLLAAECDALVGEVVNIAAGREISVNEIARQVTAATGGATPIRHGAPRPGDVRRHWADIAKAKKYLAYEPEVAFEDGLSRCVEWFRRHVSDPAAEARNIQERNW